MLNQPTRSRTLLDRAAQRKFDDAPISHSMAHHLTAVAHLLAAGGYARVSDIARFLGLTRGSVSVRMKGLRAAGYVVQDGNHFFHLTELGRRTANSLRIRYEVARAFFTESAGLPPAQAHDQSCRIAYLLTAPTARRLAVLAERSPEHPGLAELSRRCPPGCNDCRWAGDHATCPCCGLECLSAWLPAKETPPPCQETIR
jgi:Mn-dependent DtxR family transcriptional regulator